MKRLMMTLVLVLVTVATTSSAANVSSAPMTFGVLSASCDANRAAALKGAGVALVELPLAWDRYQPSAGRVDQGYVEHVRSQMATCRGAGLEIVLSPGLQYPPAWVRTLPGGTLKGSSGAVPVEGSVDLIFSAAVRAATRDYLRRLAADLGFDGVAAVRVGTTSTGELGYPGPTAGGDEPQYWAFSAAPQEGSGLAAGMAVSPLPQWRPGDADWNGRRVTARDADDWLTWYARSAVQAVIWQIEEFRALGFSRRIHVPVAGRGTLPADRAAAVAGLLDGRANPDGALERGLDYPAQFGMLAGMAGVDIDFTGLDDDTAVRARAAEPPQDRCQTSDVDDLLERSDTDDWPSQRFTSAVARRAGLGLVGENPGRPDAPNTGGSKWSDPLPMQLRMAPDYALGCGMSVFMFAFEDDLFEPPANPPGVNLDDYKAAIDEMRGNR